MTVATQTARVSYAGNGATTSFAVPFMFLANTDVLAYLQNALTGETTLLTYGTDYTVSGAGGATGGTAVLTTAPASGYRVQFVRSTSRVQGTDLLTNDALPAETVETSLDRLALAVQDVEAKVGRALRLADGDYGTDLVLPPLVTLKNKYLKGNASTGAIEPSDGTGAGAEDFLNLPDEGDEAESTDYIVTQTAAQLGTALTTVKPIESVLAAPFDRVDHDADFTLTLPACKGLHTNILASEAITGSLPAVVLNTSVVFYCDGKHDLVLSPNGTDTINGVNADLEMKSQGFVFLDCVTDDGAWVISGWTCSLLLDGENPVGQPTGGVKFLKATFGAVGDGITDDTDALEAFFAAKGNLVMEEGRFVYSRKLKPLYDSKIVGNCRGSKSVLVPVGDFSDYLLDINGDNGINDGSGYWLFNLDIFDIYMDVSGATGSWTHAVNITKLFASSINRFTVDGMPTGKKSYRVGKSNWLELFKVRQFSAVDVVVGFDVVDADGEINGLLMNSCNPERCATGVKFSGSTNSITCTIRDHYAEASDLYVDWDAGHSESGLEVFGGHIEGRSGATGVKIRRSNCTVDGLKMVSAGAIGVDIDGATSHENCHVRGGNLHVTTPVRDTNGYLATNTYKTHGTFATTWAAAGGGANIGNGSLEASYVLNGKICTMHVRLVFGSTTNGGTGEWTFTLPYTVAAVSTSQFTGPAIAIRSGVSWIAGAARTSATSTTARVYLHGGTNSTTALIPWTWGTGDELYFSVTFPLGA